MRIVSLLPGATEILYELGLGDAIVGVSDDCTFPPDVKSKPIVSRSNLPPDLSSAAIHQAAESLHRSGSVYHIDPAFLRAERPDLILAQDVCEVCAVTSEQARAAAEEALCSAIVVSVSATSLREILESIEVLGRYTATEAKAAELRERMEVELEEVRRALGDAQPVRTFYIGWLDPLMCEGHWIPEMIEIAGGRELIGRAGEYGSVVRWEEVREAAPDAVIVAPCSFDLSRTLREAALLERLPGWLDVPAVRSGRVFAADSAYFVTPGPRIAEGVRMLARALHPDRIRDPLPEGRLAVRSGRAGGEVRWEPWR
jgi:iron complex transport system substrate-binding protein